MQTPHPIDESHLTRLLQRLVKADSVNPHLAGRPPADANEEEVAQIVLQELSDAEIDCKKHYAEPHRPVVIAEMGNKQGRSLMLNAHMDTVGVAGMSEPFSGAIRGGRLHGRGATDTKSSLAAMIVALRAVAEARVELAGRCIFTAVCDEEYGGLGTQYVARAGLRADAAIIGEPTRLAIGVGQVGGVKFKIVVRGRAAHGNLPEAGVNAILKAAGLALRLPDLAKKRSHPLLGSPAFNIGKIAGGVDATTVPDYCELDCDRRLLPHETFDQIHADISELLQQMHSEDPTFHAQIQAPYLGPVPGFELPREHPLVVSMRGAFDAALGEQPKLIITPYAGDGMYIFKAGIPAITFGPGDPAHAHFAEESVELSQVARAAKVLVHTVLEFCRCRP